MHARLLDWFYSSKKFKQAYTSVWYELVSFIDKNGLMRFMNYGYQGRSTKLKLKSEDENDRSHIELYHHLIKDIDLTNKDLLEISCGRGGGISYYSRYFGLKQAVGLDITKQAIAFCKKKYHLDSTAFIVGDAQSLPFEDDSFDIVVNLEASGNYPQITTFFHEVERVLRPGGYFAYADLRKSSEMKKWNDQLKQLSMRLVAREDITDSVCLALERTSESKQRLIDKYIPKVFHTQFYEFAGIKGSNYVYNALKSRQKMYIRYLFVK